MTHGELLDKAQSTDPETMLGLQYEITTMSEFERKMLKAALADFMMFIKAVEKKFNLPT